MKNTLVKTIKSDKSLLSSLIKKDTDVIQNSPITKEGLSEFTYSFNLPSNGVFNFGKKEILLKPLSIGQVVDIHKNVKSLNVDGLRQLVTILNHSIFGINLEDLTLNDFYALCFELRFMSYNEPISVIKQQKVGNDYFNFEKPIIKESLIINKLTDILISSEFDYPRVRDKIFELENMNECSDLEKTFFGFANGDSPEDKLDNFRNFNLESFNLIAEYAVKNEHGVQSKLKLFNEDGTYEESEVSFSHEMFFPRIIGKYLHRLGI